MSKAEFRRAVIAALLGALVTFFTHLLEAFLGVDGSIKENVMGGVVASGAFLKMTLKAYI